MLSDEEKQAIDNMKSLLLYSKEHEYFSPFQEQEIDDMNIVLNLIEKQSKEIEEYKKQLDLDNECEIALNSKVMDLEKEIEELKAISEYREKIIKGLGLKTLPKTITGFKELIENNDKKWEDKIKAKIEEVEKELNKLLQKEEWLEPHDTTKRNKYMYYIEFGQSLLEKE